MSDLKNEAPPNFDLVVASATPESDLERAHTEPPVPSPDAAPPINEVLSVMERPDTSTISERASEISEQLQEIPPPPDTQEDQPQLSAELVDIWKTLGQLGVAFTDVSSRVAKIEKFLGLKT
jgi:hypothetical protein